MYLVPVRVLRLYVDKPFTHTGTHLRGAFLHQFPDRELLHNRRADGVARLPDVRFVVRDKIPHVVALGSGRAEVLDLYRRITEIPVPGGKYRVSGPELLDEPIGVGVVPELNRYDSATPWLGLNQENFSKFNATSKGQDRRKLLQRILVGNFLVTLRQLEVNLGQEEKILISIEDWSKREIEVRGLKLTGFYLRFTTNLRWSPWLGVGKQSAKGFGLFD